MAQIIPLSAQKNGVLVTEQLDSHCNLSTTKVGKPQSHREIGH